MFGDETLFTDLALLLLAATSIGALATFLRQPLIVAFIAVGVAAGPTYLGLVGESETWGLLSTLGISLLLFVVGLRLDLQEIRAMGPIALTAGIGQMVLTSAIGFALVVALGLGVVAALYVAVTLTFSSTIIIVKLLSDKREIDSLHGRIAIGVLIVQDVVVVMAMIGISAVGAGAGEHPAPEAALVLLKGALLVAGIAVLMRFVLPTAFHHFARSTELLLLGAITWAILMAVSAEALGFSKEVGAFLAGVSLASTPVREAIGSRLVTLRDFLLLFFFLTLGASLDLTALGEQIVPAVLLSLFVLVGKPLIVMAIMGFMGYRRRTSFLAGLTVAQVSEFSLILGALGVGFGHIDEATLGLITLSGLVTIGLSTYLILYSHPLYERLAPWLRIFERRVPYRELDGEYRSPRRADVIVFGLGRYGGEIARQLRDRGLRVMGVDFDPEVIRAWAEQGIIVHYGDIEDPEFAATLPLRDAQWIVSAVRVEHSNFTLLHTLREYGYHGRMAVAAQDEPEVPRLRAAGADVVLLPFLDAAEQAADVVSAAFEESGRDRPREGRRSGSQA